MAFSPTRRIASRSAQSAVSFAHRLTAFSSIRKPFRPSVTPSAAQLPAMSTLGQPLAAASRTTRPFVSKVEGNRNRSARLYHARSVSRSAMEPVKKQRSESRSVSTSARTSFSSPPAPMNTMRKSCPCSRSARSASRMICRPLYHISRPTKRNSGTPSGRS